MEVRCKGNDLEFVLLSIFKVVASYLDHQVNTKENIYYNIQKLQ